LAVGLATLDAEIDRDFEDTYLAAMKCLFCTALGILLSSTLLAAENAPGTGPSFKGPLGLQMYSLRFYSPNKLLAKLDKVQEFGLKTIEGGSPPPDMSLDQFFNELEKRNLTLISTGVDFAKLKSNPDALVEQAKKPFCFVVNGATPRTNIAKEAVGALAEHGKVAPVTIHHRVDFAASMVDGRTVSELAPESRSAQEITLLWKYVSAQLRKYAKDK